jgi:ACT domain-containing protein
LELLQNTNELDKILIVSRVDIEPAVNRGEDAVALEEINGCGSKCKPPPAKNVNAAGSSICPWKRSPAPKFMSALCAGDCADGGLTWPVPKKANRIIITVLGHDRVGIIAMVSNILADHDINILDISQTILQGFFTMVMVVDVSRSKIDVKELREILGGKGLEMGLQITAQHEDLFKYMHRI